MDKTKIVEQLKPQLKRRNEVEVKVARLKKALAEYEQETEKLTEKVQAMTSKIAADLGEGRDVANDQRKLRNLRTELAETEDLARELKEVALFQARETLKGAQEALDVATKSVIVGVRAIFEKKMSGKIDDFVDLYDEYKSLGRKLYDEIRVTQRPGTISEAPRVTNERFARYLTNVGMGLIDKA